MFGAAAARLRLLSSARLLMASKPSQSRARSESESLVPSKDIAGGPFTTSTTPCFPSSTRDGPEAASCTSCGVTSPGLRIGCESAPAWGAIARRATVWMIQPLVGAPPPRPARTLSSDGWHDFYEMPCTQISCDSAQSPQLLGRARLSQPIEIGTKLQLMYVLILRSRIGAEAIYHDEWAWGRRIIIFRRNN
ncbi:hypothetical protein C8R44DRAFT_738263 [Mycena epipterygia]|nr:hypothetical protein C8R44DRAFT_738263 [Mycena epipterygia]